jgi:hypothetical protein
MLGMVALGAWCGMNEDAGREEMVDTWEMVENENMPEVSITCNEACRADRKVREDSEANE